MQSAHASENASENAAHGTTSHSESYAPPHHFNLDLGGATIHLDTLVGTWVVMAVLIIVAIIATKKLQQKPDKKQVFFESVVDFSNSIVSSQIKKDTYKYVPLIGTIFLFVVCSNWMGLMPWRLIELAGIPHEFEIAAPTNDVNTTGALALIAVASYFYFGIRKNGIGHFAHYFKPMPLMAPMNMMEDLTRPLSLMFRLFGNIIGGEIVIGILIFLTAPTIVLSLVALPMFAMEVFVGFIQAFIFAILTASYIGAMVADHH